VGQGRRPEAQRGGPSRILEPKRRIGNVRANRSQSGSVGAVLAAAVLLAVGGCGDDGARVVLDDLVITTATTGLDIDPGGYLVVVEDVGSRTIGPSGTVTFEGVPSGSYLVELTGIPANCTLAGTNPRTVTTGSGDLLAGRFEVTCVQNLGTVEATVTSSGVDVPGGYSLVLGDTMNETVAANGVTVIGGVPAGDISAELVLPGNCTLQGENPRTLAVPFSDAVATSYAVLCGPTEDMLEVMTSTTGEDLDPDGYSVVVNDTIIRPIGVNDAVSFSDLASGDHLVELTGVAANCTVSGDNPRTVTIPPDDAASTTFEVTCVPNEGALEVVASTGGGDLDPDGYTVVVADTLSQAIGLDDVVWFSPVTAGDLTVELTDLAANCTVSGDNPRTVSVAVNDTASTTFEVECDPHGDLEVTTATSGMSLPGGFTVAVDGEPDQAVGPNGSVVFPGLPAGDHLVELSDLPDHCQVVDGPNPRTVTVTGGLGSTAFEVTCWGWLVFDSDRTGSWDVFIMRHDGSQQTNLTEAPDSSDRQPVVSPDGTKIAFASTRTGTEHIHVMNRDGTGVQQLTTVNRAKEPYWSPDGTRIVFSARIGGNQWDIWVMDADGQNQENLTNHSAGDFRAEWSPDGTKIVFDSDRNGVRDVFVMNADGSGVTPLETGDGGNPTWSPDGTRIAYTGNTNGVLDVWVMDADGSNRINLTSFPGANDGEAAWSPDGTTIAFATERHGKNEIYLMNPDGTNLRRLTENADHDMWPSWVPIP
jgi:Tol biopolymer transport system component